MARKQEKESVSAIKDFTIIQIKKVTPYLDDLKLTPKMRKFSWYYCTNGFHAQNAGRKAGYKDNKNLRIRVSELLTKSNIKEAIRLVLNNVIDVDRDTLKKRLLDRWITQAFYNPSDFIDRNGAPKFETWKDIPKHLHCCVESIETKWYGKDGDRKQTIIKLVDQKYPQNQLDKYIQMTRETVEVNHSMQDEVLKKLNKIKEETVDNSVIDFSKFKSKGI